MKLHHDGIRYTSNISAASVAMVSHLIQHWLVRYWRLIHLFMRMNHASIQPSIQQRQFAKQRRSIQAVARRRAIPTIPANTIPAKPIIDWSNDWAGLEWRIPLPGNV